MSEPEIIMPAKPSRRMSIKGLVPALPERGKVKIGMLGQKRRSEAGNEYQQPIRLDYFRVTTMERGEDGNFIRDEAIHEQIGDKPTEISVRLLYDDIDLNFPTRYAAYYGRSTLWCSGDGERASRLQRDKTHKTIGCPCPLADPSYVQEKGGLPKCKMNGSLSVIIDGRSGLGGVWKFRTTGFNSITALLGTMEFLATITGGPLANIPFKLRLLHKQGNNPVDGSPVEIRYVTLEYAGNEQELRQVGYQIALERETTHVSILEIETMARRRLQLTDLTNVPLPGDETEDVVEEFFPEQTGDAENFTDAPPTRAQFRQRTQTQSENTASTVSGEVNTRNARNSESRESPQTITSTGGGVILPEARPGQTIIVKNQSEKTISVHPHPTPAAADDPGGGYGGSVGGGGPGGGYGGYSGGPRSAADDALGSSSEAKAGHDGVALNSIEHPAGPGVAEDAEASIETVEIKSWHVTNPEDGEVKSYPTTTQAEVALMAILKEGMHRSLNAKPGTILARSLETAIEINDGLLRAFPPEVHNRLAGKIDAAIAQVLARHAGKKVAQEPPKQSDAISEALGPEPPAASQGPGLPAPGYADTSNAAPRDIEMKLQPFGPGRGVNWSKVVDDTIALIGDMTLKELEDFPAYGGNGRIIAQLRLMDSQNRNLKSLPQHWTRVETALAERAAALQGRSAAT